MLLAMEQTYEQRIWDEGRRLRSQIEAALEYTGGTHTWEDIIKGCVDGTFQLWPGENTVVITELLNTPRRRNLHIFLAGGTLEELESMQPKVIEWGKRMGCTTATIAGRPGWERTFLRHTGWEKRYVVFGKELTCPVEEKVGVPPPNNS